MDPGTVFTTLYCVFTYQAFSRLVADWYVSYKGNEVLWIQTLGPYSQHFIVFVTYEWAKNKQECLSLESISNLLKN
jgi:hypothetical protein